MLLPRGADFGWTGAGARVLKLEGVLAACMVLGVPSLVFSGLSNWGSDGLSMMEDGTTGGVV